MRISSDEVRALAILADRAVRDEAGAAAYRRGVADAEAGAVSALRFARGVLTARVRGTRRYRVAIAVDDGITARCNCPAGAEGAFCAHCVAAVTTWIGSLRGT